ncbi:MAG: hypothetical protein KDI21_00135 [Halieaceae bacterium]|nr:hypothetical protein [Halieaceae bacterium]
MMKIVRAAVATALFLAVLIAVYLGHVRYFQVDVVFYSALLDVLVAVLVTAAILFSLRFFGMFNPFEKCQLVVIWVLVGYALAISVPTVIDRSLSFYILEKLAQRGGGIQLASFEEVFTREYVREHRLVDVRLTEQRESGTIVIDAGCVRLTPWGEQLAGFSRFFRRHFLPRQRLLMEEYSDDLTDPFRGQRPSAGDYGC